MIHYANIKLETAAYLARSSPRVAPFDMVKKGKKPMKSTGTLAGKDMIQPLQQSLQHGPTKHCAALNNTGTPETKLFVFKHFKLSS